MKKILVLAALLWSAAALAQTSVWKIAHVMAQEGSKGVYVLESSDFQGCLDAFCDKFVDNSLTAAIRGSDALPIEHRYRGDDYARVQLKQKDFAEMEARLGDLDVEDLLQLPLNAEEQEKFHNCCESIRENFKIADSM